MVEVGQHIHPSSVEGAAQYRQLWRRRWDTGEAIGIVLAARAVGLAIGISFTVGTDGHLPKGAMLEQVIRTLENEAPPDHVLRNCAHPRHIAAGVAGTVGAVLSKEVASKITGLRSNASTHSHEELNDATGLDEGNPTNLRKDQLV